LSIKDNYFLLLRPPGEERQLRRRPLCFTADVFFCHFAAWYLWAPSADADRRETLTDDWKCVHLDNIAPKIGRQLLYAPNLQAPSADRRVTLPNDRKYVQL